MRLERQLSYREIAYVKSNPEEFTSIEVFRISRFLIRKGMIPKDRPILFGNYMVVDIGTGKVTVDVTNLSHPPNEKEPYTDPVRRDKGGQYSLLAYVPNTRARDMRVVKEDGCLGLYSDAYKTRVRTPVNFYEVEKRDVAEGIIEIVLR